MSNLLLTSIGQDDIIQKLTRERIDLEIPERHCGLVLLK